MKKYLEELQLDVMNRARHGDSEEDLGGLIYDAVHAAELDWRQISLEDAKQLLMIAVRSFRKRNSGLPGRVRVNSATMSVV